jgi:hypothetical protein
LFFLLYIHIFPSPVLAIHSISRFYPPTYINPTSTYLHQSYFYVPDSSGEHGQRMMMIFISLGEPALRNRNSCFSERWRVPYGLITRSVQLKPSDQPMGWGFRVLPRAFTSDEGVFFRCVFRVGYICLR